MTSHPELPVQNLREALPYLRRPFTPAAVKFRILRGTGKAEQACVRCAAYIDARLVGERLNLVCPDLWWHSFDPVQGGMQCHLTVDGLTRSDVGWSRSRDDMGLKGLYSDALKRAAVHFGVGVSLYAVPGLVLAARDNARWFKVAMQGEGSTPKQGEGSTPKYSLNDAGELELRRRYRVWLDTLGIRDFGVPLDHGDVEDDPAVETAPEGVNPETGELIEPERRDVERTNGTDVETAADRDVIDPADQAWFDQTWARIQAMRITPKMLKGAFADIGAHAPDRVSSWPRTLCRLSDGQRAALNLWLLEREEAGTPFETSGSTT
jgi:hypothetical protein